MFFFVMDHYWLNPTTGATASAIDLAEYLMYPHHARRLGLDKKHECLLRKFDWRTSAWEIFAIAMEGGLVRLRRHEDRIIGEFTHPLRQVLPAIRAFCEQQGMIGVQTIFSLSNPKEMRHALLPIAEFTRLLTRPGSTWQEAFGPLPEFPGLPGFRKGLEALAEADERDPSAGNTRPAPRKAGTSARDISYLPDAESPPRPSGVAEPPARLSRRPRSRKP